MRCGPGSDFGVVEVAQIAVRVERDVGGEADAGGAEGRGEARLRRNQRGSGPGREAHHGDSLGIDARVPRQERQRALGVDHPRRARDRFGHGREARAAGDGAAAAEAVDHEDGDAERIELVAPGDLVRDRAGIAVQHHHRRHARGGDEGQAQLGGDRRRRGAVGRSGQDLRLGQGQRRQRVQLDAKGRRERVRVRAGQSGGDDEKSDVRRERKRSRRAITEFLRRTGRPSTWAARRRGGDTPPGSRPGRAAFAAGSPAGSGTARSRPRSCRALRR